MVLKLDTILCCVGYNTCVIILLGIEGAWGGEGDKTTIPYKVCVSPPPLFIAMYINIIVIAVCSLLNG